MRLHGHFRDGGQTSYWSNPSHGPPSGMLIGQWPLDGPAQVHNIVGSPRDVHDREEAHPLVVVNHTFVSDVHLHMDSCWSTRLQRHHCTRQQPFGNTVVLHAGWNKIQTDNGGIALGHRERRAALGSVETHYDFLQVKQMKIQWKVQSICPFSAWCTYERLPHREKTSMCVLL